MSTYLCAFGRDVRNWAKLRVAMDKDAMVVLVERKHSEHEPGVMVVQSQYVYT